MTDDVQDAGPPVGGDPAARLLALLEAAKKVRNDTRLRDGWTQLLELDDSDDLPGLLSRLGDVLRLPGQVRAAIEAVADDAADLTTELPAVEKLLLGHVNVTHPNAKWEKLRAGVPDAALVQLRYVSRELQRPGPWPTARQGDVDRALKLVHKLVAEVLTADDLDAEARRVLLDHAQDLRDALERYKVAGADGITRAVERTVGATHLRRGLFERVPERVRTKLVAAAIVAMELVQTGAAVGQLSAGVEPTVTVEVIKVELGLPADAPVDLPAPEQDEAPDRGPGAAPPDEPASAGE